MARYSPIGRGLHFMDQRRIAVMATPEQVWRQISKIGGPTGWYYADWLWRLRGFIDQIFGGVGLRRGRRDPAQLVHGDPVDFWRVVAIDPPHLLLFAAEMKVPGQAWLEFRINPRGADRSELTQTATFHPLGLPGIIYWYATYPLHRLVFGGMLREIARTAVRAADSSPE